MTSNALAYFLTWTCAGTWLHGDQRGSVSRQCNQFGRKRLAPDNARIEAGRELLVQPPLTLSPKMRYVVRTTIEMHCGIKRWYLHAVNARTNHVHVVVSCPIVSPELAMEQFKSWSTRRLRSQSLVARDRDMWTEHGSAIYLWTDAQVEEKVEYVLNGQGADL